MIKYYTRACNFYYGDISKEYINKKSCLPLNGNKLISFDTIELITRKKRKRIKIKDIKRLSPNARLLDVEVAIFPMLSEEHSKHACLKR